MVDKKLTKCEMAKIIVSNFYYMNYVCTPLNKLQWKDVKKWMSHSKEDITNEYIQTLKMLQTRGEKEGQDYVKHWVEQSIEGDKVN